MVAAIELLALDLIASWDDFRGREIPFAGLTNIKIFAGAKKMELQMYKILILVLSAFLVSACSSKPPMPPEPEGPLVKVNINQPHETYGEVKK